MGFTVKKAVGFARVLIALGIFAGMAGALVLTGCATQPAAEAPKAPANTRASEVKTPTLTLLSPVEGAEVAAGDISVAVETTGLEYVMPSNTNVPGQGHVHFTLDDRPFEMSTKPEYVFNDVSPGSHRLVAELVQNNTEPFDPPIKQEVSFVAK